MTEEEDKLKELLEPDLEDTPLKQCDSCDQEFPLHTDYFHKDKQRPDGFRNVCSRCREQQRQNAIITDKSKEIDKFEQKITDFMGDVALDFKPGISRKENIGELYEGILNSFGGIKNIGALYAIVFAKGNTAVQLRVLEQIARMSSKVTEVGLADQSYGDMTEDELYAEAARNTRAAHGKDKAEALMKIMMSDHKAIEDQDNKDGEVIDVDHEVKE